MHVRDAHRGSSDVSRAGLKVSKRDEIQKAVE